MRYFGGLAVAAAAAALVMGGPAKADTTLNVSMWVPPSHPIVADMLIPWGKELEQASNGRVKFNLLPKPVVSPPQSFDAIRDGLADVTVIVHGYTPGRFVLTKAVEFPFLGDTSESISVAYERIYNKYLAKANENKGVVPLAFFTHGPGEMFNIKRPIKTLADFEGLKIRVGGGVVNDVTKALGITSLLKPAPESFELLNSGVADGVFFPKESVKSFKLDHLIKFATFVPGGLYNTSFALVMNPAKFDGLSKEDQAAVMKVSGEHFSALAGKAWDAADRAGVAAMKAAGVEMDTASPDLVAAIKGKTDPIEKAWYAEAKTKGVDGPAVMAALRAEIKKIAGK